MNFDGYLARSDFERDLLVSPTRDDQCQYRLFSRRQRSEALPKHCDQVLVLAVDPISLEGGLDCVQEVLFAKGLGQEFHCTGLHRPHRHRNVAMASQEDDWQAHIGRIQLLLKIEAALPGQAYIQHETTWALRSVVFEKFLGRGEYLDA